jgi:hypothetical protein
VIDLVDPGAVQLPGEEHEYFPVAALAHAALAGEKHVPGPAQVRELPEAPQRRRAELEAILVAGQDEGRLVARLGLMPVEVPQQLGGGGEHPGILVAELLLEPPRIKAHRDDDAPVAARHQSVPEPLDRALLEHGYRSTP